MTSKNGTVTIDPWDGLRRHTAARIALGRAGGSLPTREVLAFAAAHAAARDAVHEALDWDRLEADIRSLPCDVVRLESAAAAAAAVASAASAASAADRATYLQRPDLGRRLSDASAQRLDASDRKAAPDVALVISDGLSAPAAERQVTPLLRELLPMLRTSGVTVSPAFLVRFGRVAIEDEIGARVGAKAAVILLGERPGLGSPDSLGAYLVFNPQPGRTDAERNCVSNIRPGGLPFPAAAATLHYLITEAIRRQISGVLLKDERDRLLDS
jgi:ethanolamine ammonia-lyase small subunit